MKNSLRLVFTCVFVALALTMAFPTLAFAKELPPEEPLTYWADLRLQESGVADLGKYKTLLQNISQSSESVTLFGIIVPEETDECDAWCALGIHAQHLGINTWSDDYDKPYAAHAVGLIIHVDAKGEITQVCFASGNTTWHTADYLDKYVFYKAFPNFDRDHKFSWEGVIKMARIVAAMKK